MTDTFQFNAAPLHKYNSMALAAITTDIINKFVLNIKLEFIYDYNAANLCYAHSAGLRPEYRNAFTVNDVLNYIYGYVKISGYNNPDSLRAEIDIKYPLNADIFWQLADDGRNLREQL